jgi:molecular chaperone DnaK
VYQTERFLAESGDKIPEDRQTEVREALGELRSALGGTDVAGIKSAQERLATVSQEVGAAMYEQAQASAAGGDAGAGTDAGGSDGPTGPNMTKDTDAGDDGEDVVDAEIVDEGDKK